MTPRAAMDHALKDAIKAHLRPRGFTGSLPHLRRRSEEQICLITFQYFSSGGSFVVEVAECPPEGIITSWGKHIPPQKVTAHNINSPRPRIGGQWFVFGPRNYEPGHDRVLPEQHYDAIAAQVMRLIEEEAEPFWREQLAQRQ